VLEAVIGGAKGEVTVHGFTHKERKAFHRLIFRYGEEMHTEEMHTEEMHTLKPSSQTLLSYTPPIHSSHTLLSYTSSHAPPLIHTTLIHLLSYTLLSYTSSQVSPTVTGGCSLRLVSSLHTHTTRITLHASHY
jgi:hypothetical protein